MTDSLDSPVDGAARVRPATRADAPAVRTLQSLLPEPAPRLLALGLTAGDVLVSTTAAADPVTDTAIAGERGASAGDVPADRPVGYLLPVGGGDGDGQHATGGDGGGVHVAELAVAPTHRREGRASELCRALFRRLPPGTRVTLTVEPSNRAARACYESLGFEATDEWEDYFESGPAVVYERRAGAGDT